MMAYYQPEIETASREQIHAWQEERFLKTFHRVWKNNAYYRQKMIDAGLSDKDVTSLADLQKLPFLTKDDLREAYPFGLMSAPLSDCVRIHSTSGTTGKRVIAFYTENDLALWDDICARAIVAAGGTRDDIVQVCYGYGLFTGGMGLHGGSQKVGCLTLPMSSGNTDRQLQFMEDLGATILCCTPSYAAYLAESIHERGLEDRIHLKAGIFGAEAWTEEMRHSIEASLGLKAYDIYGLTELSGPGVAYECEAQTGMHINEDHFIAEIIDPATGEVLPYGEKGELVFTSITKEAFPLIRYRTKDICILTNEKCDCGRTFVKMCKPMGRSDDMLIIKGVNVFPSQIEMVLLAEGLTSNYQIIVDRIGTTDSLEVKVEITPELFTDTMGALTEKEKKITDALKTVLGIQAKVSIVEPKSIVRSEGKAVRVIDKRKLY
ncbi:MAG: phenylacetate--CoA ligase [Eubacteriales bacterium]|nr:phenylacetate--CoA ligase [Clostridiales bacterium]MDD7774314.1 phenylacetate--CoA ligase [Eubacteriales bacterium]MDY3942196.1 phenylacetate--CoA ligase [Eubacteriales bacterium]